MSTVPAQSLWGVIVQATLLSKLILVLASATLIACLFIFIYKLLLLREKRLQVAKIQGDLHSAQTLDDILALGSVLKGTLPGVVIGRGLTTVKTLLQSKGSTATLSIRDRELVRNVLDQALDEVSHKEHGYVALLSVSAAVAPLIGLFGTISGLIQSFIAIGLEKTANISVIAPGIAEALLTTFAGLIVAIPALLMYHYIESQIAELEYHLEKMAQRFEWVVKRMTME